MTRIHLRLVAAIALFVALIPLTAHASLTVSPLTWNIVGLDSNTPLNGPNRFPFGARVCSNVATTNVAVNFVFDSANANVNLRPWLTEHDHASLDRGRRLCRRVLRSRSD